MWRCSGSGLAQSSHSTSSATKLPSIRERTLRLLRSGLPFLGQVSARAEEPLQIPEHALAITLDRDYPLRPALLRVVRLVIRQSVKQTRLKFFDDGKFRHTLEI